MFNLNLVDGISMGITWQLGRIRGRGYVVSWKEESVQQKNCCENAKKFCISKMTNLTSYSLWTLLGKQMLPTVASAAGLMMWLLQPGTEFFPFMVCGLGAW